MGIRHMPDNRSLLNWPQVLIRKIEIRAPTSARKSKTIICLLYETKQVISTVYAIFFLHGKFDYKKKIPTSEK